MQLHVLQHLEDLPAQAWNALAGEENPFTRYEFLSALARTGCTTPDTGWQICYLLVYADPSQDQRLLGGAPLYLKNHSYGEYVFDWAWADAYARQGLAYYPKLVAAVPFTPVTGARLLVAADLDDTTANRVRRLLVDGARTLVNETQASSLHWLFTRADDTSYLESQGLLRRVGYQFHWQNMGYGHFEDFLKSLTARKRHNIKRERRHVQAAGISLEVLAGDSISPFHWDTFYGFYRATLHKHGAIPYLTREFFHELGQVMPQNLVLILACHHGKYVAGAFNLRGADTLYGRYWGGESGFHSLHFETCYYRAIEYCIETGLTRFEAGAQGEHKLARGFLPTPTYSAHWLSHPQFNQAIGDYLQREQNGLEFYLHELNEHSPFKKGS